jgi:hypothetical protein
MYLNAHLQACVHVFECISSEMCRNVQFHGNRRGSKKENFRCRTLISITQISILAKNKFKVYLHEGLTSEVLFNYLKYFLLFNSPRNLN